MYGMTGMLLNQVPAVEVYSGLKILYWTHIFLIIPRSVSSHNIKWWLLTSWENVTIYQACYCLVWRTNRGYNMSKCLSIRYNIYYNLPQVPPCYVNSIVQIPRIDLLQFSLWQQVQGGIVRIFILFSHFIF